MEIGGNKGAIKGHYLNSYHHIIHSLVLLASSEPLPKGYRRKQYIGFFDVLTYLDLTFPCLRNLIECNGILLIVLVALSAKLGKSTTNACIFSL